MKLCACGERQTPPHPAPTGPLLWNSPQPMTQPQLCPQSPRREGGQTEPPPSCRWPGSTLGTASPTRYWEMTLSGQGIGLGSRGGTGSQQWPQILPQVPGLPLVQPEPRGSPGWVLGWGRLSLPPGITHPSTRHQPKLLSSTLGDRRGQTFPQAVSGRAGPAAQEAHCSVAWPIPHPLEHKRVSGLDPGWAHGQDEEDPAWACELVAGRWGTIWV